mgnify:CR=1 FL=1
MTTKDGMYTPEKESDWKPKYRLHYNFNIPNILATFGISILLLVSVIGIIFLIDFLIKRTMSNTTIEELKNLK